MLSRKDNHSLRDDSPIAHTVVGQSNYVASGQKKRHRYSTIFILALLVLMFPGTTLLNTQAMLKSTQIKQTHNTDYHMHKTSALDSFGAIKKTVRAIAGLTPQNLWKMYNLPGLNGGEGQLIAEVIDGGIPTMEADLRVYNQQFGLPDCSFANGCLTTKYQGGQKITAGGDPIEGILDVEIMHAIAPKAKILLYIVHEDNGSVARGPAEIIKTPGLRSINMSYGFDGNGKRYESLYTNNPNQVALFAASGDDGYAKITPPSIYPGVIAVGGTSISGNTETAWSGSGGGLARNYEEPDYQKNYGIPRANNRRGNPDIAAVAGTNVAIYEQGRWAGETGTSVSSPIWTGIAALVNKPITNNMLYSLAKSQPDSFNDITTGHNGNCGFICTAQPGYDYVTGLGTPKNFVKNVNAMR